jgi:16S rRNA (cytosine1402-N4)-methyltransferase
MRTRHIRSSSDLVPAAEAKVGHQSVLLQEAIEFLSIKSDDTVVDGTLGAAGHAQLIAEKLGNAGTFAGFDLDTDAIGRAQVALKGVRPRVYCIEADFRDLESQLRSRDILHIDKAIFDLGWSGYQLAAGRGFSFLTDEPLLMTYAKDTTDRLTAATIVNEWKEESIADIIFGWGEERYSRRIARAIVERRKIKPFATANDLADTIRGSVPAIYRHGRLHPATRTFQALRIAVNDELGAVRDGVTSAWSMLRSGGRIAVITFHSLEDRIVKELFLEFERKGEGMRITRSPLKPTAEELSANPRARSAKLRVIEKN